MKLYEAGEPNRTLHQILEENVRVPVQVMGDLSAQLAACSTCERGLIRLVSRYGADAFEGYIEALHDYAERLMREEITALPDGVYEFEDWLDGLGEDPKPIRFKVAVTIAGDGMTIDWTGTSKQVKGAINGPIATTYSMAYAAARCLARGPIPNCQGFTRPIEVRAPLGTIVNPTEPAACAARAIIAFRMFDTIFGALAQAAPDRISAAGEGGTGVLQFGGRHDDGKPWVLLSAEVGCRGGRRECDGLEGVTNLAGGGCNQPIEVLEAGLPIEITRYGYIENSGGPGRSRGGYAYMRGYRMLNEESRVDIRSDRRAVLPYGLDGGLPGTPSWNILNLGPNQRLLPACPMETLYFERGDVCLYIQPGGGGYGDPLERDPARVLDDVLNELITVDYAFDVYGVAMMDDGVDANAIAARRAELAAAEPGEPAYLQHFHKSIGVDPRERTPDD